MVIPSAALLKQGHIALEGGGRKRAKVFCFLRQR